MKQQIKKHFPTKKVTLELSYETNAIVERYQRKIEISTGSKPTKADAINYLINSTNTEK